MNSTDSKQYLFLRNCDSMSDNAALHLLRIESLDELQALRREVEERHKLIRLIDQAICEKQITATLETKEDKRIVYGARCTWWDSIDKCSTVDTGKGFLLPCCPICHGMLCEVSSIEEWMDQIDAYTNDGHPRYRSLMLWMRGKCFKSMHNAELARMEQAVGQLMEPYR